VKIISFYILPIEKNLDTTYNNSAETGESPSFTAASFYFLSFLCNATLRLHRRRVALLLRRAAFRPIWGLCPQPPTSFFSLVRKKKQKRTSGLSPLSRPTRSGTSPLLDAAKGGSYCLEFRTGGKAKQLGLSQLFFNALYKVDKARFPLFAFPFHRSKSIPKGYAVSIHQWNIFPVPQGIPASGKVSPIFGFEAVHFRRCPWF